MQVEITSELAECVPATATTADQAEGITCLPGSVTLRPQLVCPTQLRACSYSADDRSTLSPFVHAGYCVAGEATLVRSFLECQCAESEPCRAQHSTFRHLAADLHCLRGAEHSRVSCRSNVGSLAHGELKELG